MELSSIKKLAELSRINFSEKELDSFRGDFDAILGYVDQIKNVKIEDSFDNKNDDYQIKNVFREDEVKDSFASDRKTLIDQSAPDSLDGFLKVKKIL